MTIIFDSFFGWATGHAIRSNIALRAHNRKTKDYYRCRIFFQQTATFCVFCFLLYRADYFVFLLRGKMMRPNPTYCPIKVPRRHVRYAETYVRATLYTSPYLVATPKGYTKHYYAESERITSQLGKGQFADVGTPVVSDSLVQVKLQEVTDNVEYPSTLTVPSSGTFAYLDTLTNQQNATSTLYFYHPDHLGSSSWITTTNGTVKQHLHYLPWGEDCVNQRSSHFDGVRYTFSAKEKDTETGYSYFGARYYSSDLSIWLSVDPMSDKYPSLSPYVYCANNPVKLVDPNGEDVWKPDGKGG